jgi:hypothetical protein
VSAVNLRVRALGQRRLRDVVLLPVLAEGLPANQSPPVIGEDYVLPAGCRGKVQILGALDELPANEILVVEAWDLS